MREIKFRTWDKVNKKFIYCSDYWLGNSNNTLYDELKELDWEQYTGLKDKNGKEIYEGDIIKTEYDINHSIGIGVVKMIDACWNISFRKGRLPVDPTTQCLRNQDYLKMFLPVIGSKMEVIGNIYENQELLK